MLKMGIPEVAIKQKMTMDGIDWRAKFEAPAASAGGGAGAGAAARNVITADALQGVQLKSASKRKLVRSSVPSPFRSSRSRVGACAQTRELCGA